MTETQTPVCRQCGDTGYVPPFMDPCDCMAGLTGKSAAAFKGEPDVVPGTVLTALAAPVPTEVLEMPWLPPHPAPGTRATLRGGKYVVWTGDKWVDLPTREVAPGDPSITRRPPMDADVADALDELGDTTDLLDAVDEAAEAMGAEWAARYAAEADTEVEFEPILTTDVIAETTAAATPKTSKDTFAALEAACEAIPTPPKRSGKVMSEKQETLIRRLIAERDPANPHVAYAQGRLGGETPVTAKTASVMIDKLVAVPADRTRKPARKNSYDGICIECGGEVLAGTGRIVQIDGRWKTVHSTSAHCLSDAEKAAMEADKVIEPGLYKHCFLDPASSGSIKTDVYRVRTARTSKRLYGELVVPPATDDDKVEFIYNGKAMAFLRRSNRLTWQEARDFGAAYGACIACGRTLEDARSLVQQYGATCAGHYGWPTVTKTQAEAIIAGVITWEDVTGLPG